MLRIEDELKNNQISRFQLLYGEERYMVQYYRNQLIEKLSNPDDEMNRTFFRDKPEPSQIAEAAQILPFFAENRLIVVEDSGIWQIMWNHFRRPLISFLWSARLISATVFLSG